MIFLLPLGQIVFSTGVAVATCAAGLILTPLHQVLLKSGHRSRKDDICWASKYPNEPEKELHAGTYTHES